MSQDWIIFYNACSSHIKMPQMILRTIFKNLKEKQVVYCWCLIFLDFTLKRHLEHTSFYVGLMYTRAIFVMTVPFHQSQLDLKCTQEIELESTVWISCYKC